MSRKDRSWKRGDVERKRGILNSRERRYLLTNGKRSDLAKKRGVKDEMLLTGENEIESGSPGERAIRQQIRNHTMNAILDFPYLVGHLEERDKRRILNDGYDPSNSNENMEQSGQLEHVNYDLPTAVAFLYQLYQMEYSDATIHEFEELVRKGVETAHLTEGREATATVDISVDIGDSVGELLSRYENEGVESLTEQEAHLLYEYDEITREEYIEWLKKSGGD
jgi:hypothetical protein